MRLRRIAHGEMGETLAELLVTIAVLGIAVVIIVGALATGIAASSTHRARATGDTLARSIAEAVKDRTVALDPNGSYPSSIWSGTVDTSGYTVTVTASCLKPSDISVTTLTASNFTSCPTTTGVQLVTVTVTSTGKGEQEEVQILKRRS